MPIFLKKLVRKCLECEIIKKKEKKEQATSYNQPEIEMPNEYIIKKNL